MPWVKLDDGMPEHRKIRDLPDAAFRLHVSAICWCNRHLTDGRIGENDLRHVSDVKGAKRHADTLVNVGLWKPTEDGWLIHDYLEYQFSADKIRAERRAAAERQARWKEKRRGGNGVSNAVSNAYPAPAPTPSPRKGRSGVAETATSTEVIHNPPEQHHFNGEEPDVCVDCGLPAANRRHTTPPLRLVEGGNS